MRRIERLDVGVLLAEVVSGLRVVRPLEAHLQTVVARRGGRVPLHRGQGRAARHPLDRQIHVSGADGLVLLADAETQEGEMHRQIDRRRLHGSVPDSREDEVVGIGGELVRRHDGATGKAVRAHRLEPDVRVVPGDRETLGHQELLRIDQRVGSLVDVTGNADRAATGRRTIRPEFGFARPEQVAQDARETPLRKHHEKQQKEG